MLNCAGCEVGFGCYHATHVGLGSYGCVLIQIWARDLGLNNWEHRGEGMYCPRALLKIPGSGTTFVFALRTPLLLGVYQWMRVWVIAGVLDHEWRGVWSSFTHATHAHQMCFPVEVHIVFVKGQVVEDHCGAATQAHPFGAQRVVRLPAQVPGLMRLPAPAAPSLLLCHSLRGALRLSCAFQCPCARGVLQPWEAPAGRFGGRSARPM